MKKIFTKTIGFVAAVIFFVGIALPACAQTFTKQVIASTGFFTAMTKDGNGNIYVIRCLDGINSEVEKCLAGQTSFNAIFTGLKAGTNDENSGTMPWGLAVNSLGDVYITTNFSSSNTLNGAVGNLSNTGNIIKLATNNGFNGTSYTPTVIQTGRYYTGLAFDSSNNLYALQMDAAFNNYTVTEYTSLAVNAAGTQLFTGLNDNAFDNYPQNVAVASNFDVYVTNATRQTGHTTGNITTDGVDVRKYTKASSYASFSQVSVGKFATALALDPSGNLYVSETDGSRFTNYRLNKYTNGSGSPTQIVALDEGGGMSPMGIAPVSSGNIYVADGNNPGAVWRMYGAPSTAASGVSFSNIATQTATVTWSGNGDGATRAVFIKQASSGSPTPVNNTTYLANVNFQSGSQIGATGWYCIYNNSGSPASLNVTGLAQGLTYSVMVVEYNGSAGAENYLQTTGTNNPNTFTTLSPTTINSLNRVTGTPSNLATVNFSAVFGAAVTGVTASNFSLTTSGVSGASIGTPTTSDNITWTVPVSTGTGDGTIQLNLANATGLSKTITTIPFPGQSYTIDKTAPSVSSIVATGSSPTNASSLGYTVTFSESVTGVDATDFTATVSGVTTSGINVTPVSGTVYTVTVTGASGTGTVRLDLKSSGTSIIDAASNAISGGFTSGSTYNVDQTAPTVSSIVATGSTTTNASSLGYTVTFSEAVTGVDATDFTATVSGVTTSGINVTPVSSTIYTVTISGASGNGTVRLDLKNSGTGIIDAVGNAISGGFTGGSTYNVDQTAPSASSIVATGSSPTNASSLGYTVTFSEAVTGVDATDFTATVSGVTTSGINVTPVSSTIYTVTVTGASGNGTVRLDLKSSGTGIIDAASNAISGGFTGGSTYNVDQTAPSVSSIVATGSSPTNASSLGYTVTFSEAVTGVDATDFTATVSGVTTSGINVTPVSSTVYTVTVTGASGNGTVRLDLKSSGTGITDAAGNTASGFTGGNTYTVDNTAPTLSIVRSDSSPISDNVLDFQAVFSEAVTGVDAADFTLTTTGGITNGSISLTPINSTTYNITVSSVVGTGTARLDLNGSGTGITDVAGNAPAGYTGGEVYNVDQTPPTALSLVYKSDNANQLIAAPGNKVSLTFTTSETIQTPTVTIGGHAITATNTSGNDWVASYTVTGADPVGRIHFSTTITDAAGNSTPYNDIAAGDDVEVVSNNANLSALALNSGTLSPVFASGTTSYTAEVINAITTIEVTPTSADAGATITVNGTAVTSGSASTDINLDPGAHNTLTVVVTAQDGTTIKTYTIDVFRDPNSNPNLVFLDLDHGVLSPAFTSLTTSYTASVGSGTATVTVTPTVSTPHTVVTVNGSTTASGTASAPVSLNFGPNTITVLSTAQDGIVTKTYTVTVTRAFPANADLTSLKLSNGAVVPPFSSGTTSYTSSVGPGAAAMTVTPTTFDPLATVTVNGTTVTSGSASQSLPLSFGPNVITIEVTGQDGSTVKDYTLTVTRVTSTNAGLASLHLSNGTPIAFSPSTTTYTTSVSPGTSSLTVTPVTVDANATVMVNGSPVTSGSPSSSLPLNFGTNTITTIVTAQDGTTTKTYTVTVTRNSRTNADLTNLTLSEGTLTPAFSSGTISYTASVGSGITSMMVTPTTFDPLSTVTVNGTTVASGSASQSLPLSFGPNVITIEVTAQDGSTVKDYTLTVTRAISTNAGLASLHLSNGTPIAFSPSTTTYTTSVSPGTSSLTVTPVTADANAAVTVNGTAVASGSPSSSIPLSFGTNTITTIVTAQDGTTTKTYTVTVTRNSRTNADLTNLTLSEGTLTPAFLSGTISYTASVGNVITSMTVTPTTFDPLSTVTVNGSTVASGAASQSISLSYGPNVITVEVTAQDGSTVKDYTLTVTRVNSTNANLSALHLSNGGSGFTFSPSTTTYTTSVAAGTSSLTVTPVTADANATVTVNGSSVASGSPSSGISLNFGSNIITTVVTAQDGTTTKTYTVTVTRNGHSNADLTNLTLSKGTLAPVFSSGTTSYTANVGNAITSIKITPTTFDDAATVTVNGDPVGSGVASADLPLTIGDNTITTIVTAQNGTSTKTYTVTVTRATGPVPVANVNIARVTAAPSDEVIVHQGISPNGDGENDGLKIDGIANYPENRLMIMNRSGVLVYEAKGYNNSSNVFDGHSNKNGKLQQPGTYFYSLEYKAGGVTKHKTGFILLKY